MLQDHSDKEREGRNEGNILFNDALNTFYGIGRMLQDHSDKEREGRNEGNVLFNDALNTFYGIGRMLQDHSDKEREGRKEMFYLMMHSTHFMASDICYMITQIRREKEGRKCFI